MSVQVPKGYKQTEVGMIPEDWNNFSIGDLISFQGGSQPDKSFFSYSKKPGYIRLIQIRDYKTDKFEVFVPANLVRRFCDENDIMIGRYGPPVFQILRGISGAYNVALIKATPSESINKEYAYYYLKQDSLFNFIDKLSQRSSGQTGVDLKELKAYPFVFPASNSEQEAIVKALSDADALIESLEQLIAKKRQIKQGAMQELLTGQRRLPGFSGEWIQQRLGDIAHIKTGGRNNQDKVENGEFPFFVRSATVERINTFTYDCEAILVPGEGGIGSIFHYIFGKFDVHQRVYAITQFAGNVSGKFIYYHMKTYFGQHAMENSVKATVDSLRLPTFQDFVVKLPSSVEEQIEIASILSEMEQELEMLEERLQKAQTIKQAMMQELLTGRIRLI